MRQLDVVTTMTAITSRTTTTTTAATITATITTAITASCAAVMPLRRHAVAPLCRTTM